MADLLHSAAELVPLESLFDPAYPERLREVAVYLYLQLIEEPELVGLGLPRLASLALAQTERLSCEIGGGNFYMHKGQSYRLSLRDRQIWSDFTGTNFSYLAKKYNLSEMRIRQILDEIRRQEIERRQGALEL